VCLEYLERYFTLICFCSYITGAHFPPASPAALTFGEWLGGRPELRSILERLLRYNPAAALGLNKPPDALAASECSGGASCVPAVLCCVLWWDCLQRLRRSGTHRVSCITLLLPHHPPTPLFPPPTNILFISPPISRPLDIVCCR
jgi:hypothetical protein